MKNCSFVLVSQVPFLPSKEESIAEKMALRLRMGPETPSEPQAGSLGRAMRFFPQNGRRGFLFSYTFQKCKDVGQVGGICCLHTGPSGSVDCWLEESVQLLPPLAHGKDA